MDRRRKWVVSWMGLMSLSIVPTATAGGVGGLATEICLPFGLIIALTMTPVDSLATMFTDALDTVLPSDTE